MRSVEKVRIISCQVQYVPLGTNDVNVDVEKVLTLIEESGLNYEPGPMTTTISGNPERVFHLIQRIETEMSENNRKFTMTILLSNECGCQK